MPDTVFAMPGESDVRKKRHPRRLITLIGQESNEMLQLVKLVLRFACLPTESHERHALHVDTATRALAKVDRAASSYDPRRCVSKQKM